jgi:hypothetical protein
MIGDIVCSLPVTLEGEVEYGIIKNIPHALYPPPQVDLLS